MINAKIAPITTNQVVNVTFMRYTNFVKGPWCQGLPQPLVMWSQLRDISIRIDEDAERGTPLNVSKFYVDGLLSAN